MEQIHHPAALTLENLSSENLSVENNRATGAMNGSQLQTTSQGSPVGTAAAGKICRVLLVDPDALIRYSIGRLISSIESFEVIADVGTAEEAIALLEKGGIDLLVVEIALPKVTGLELLHELNRKKIPHRTIVLSHVDSPEMITEALLAGAQGYVLKSGSYDDLVAGLTSAYFSNKRFLPTPIAHLSDIPPNSHQLGGAESPNDPLSSLSPREREIFHLLAHGLQNTVIAKKLFISPRTVETHRARVVRKLGLQTNGELIRFAIKRGLTLP